MPTFDTPRPISVVLDIVAGAIHINASERADTAVEVRPADAANPADVKAAEQTRVDFKRGRLLVKTPSPSSRHGVFREGGAIDVTVDLPEGSDLRGGSVLAELRSEGRLGECRFDTVNGGIRLDQSGPLRLTAVSGDTFVARVQGDVKITNDSGEVHVVEIAGSADIKNRHGASSVDDITGTLKLSGTDGNFHVRRAQGDVEARTAHGDIRIDEVVRGEVTLVTAFGEIEVGIREGTAARLDLRTVSGRIRNSLASVDGPGETDRVVVMRTQTFDGDVVIRRSQLSQS